MVAMLKKMQNDLQIMLTDPYAHVYCEKSQCVFVGKGESREFDGSQGCLENQKGTERLDSLGKALIEGMDGLSSGNHKQMTVHLLSEPPTSEENRSQSLPSTIYKPKFDSMNAYLFLFSHCIAPTCIKQTLHTTTIHPFIHPQFLSFPSNDAG